MPHFEFHTLTLEGRRTGVPVKCQTVAGIILQCPNVVDVRQIEHLCEVARVTPEYPVDLTHFTGPEYDRRLSWNARIYYRSK